MFSSLSSDSERVEFCARSRSKSDLVWATVLSRMSRCFRSSAYAFSAERRASALALQLGVEFGDNLLLRKRTCALCAFEHFARLLRLADIVGGGLLRKARFALGFVRLAFDGHRAGLRRLGFLLQYLRLRALLPYFRKKTIAVKASKHSAKTKLPCISFMRVE